MPEIFTLKDIIEIVLEDACSAILNSDLDEKHLSEEYIKHMDSLENKARSLYRKFAKLISLLGGDKDILKNGGKYIEFDESAAPAIRVLMSQLYTEKGIIAEFVKTHKYKPKFSSNDVIEFIQTLRDEASKDDTRNREELAWLAQFFENIFLNSPPYLLTTCHTIIDALAAELHDLPYNEQSISLKKVGDILRAELSLRIDKSPKSFE